MQELLKHEMMFRFLKHRVCLDLLDTQLRLFLTIALHILSAHNLWRHLACSRARAH